MFIKRFKGAKLDNTIDAIFIVLILIWFVIQFFNMHGIIAIGPMLLILINPYHISEYRTKLAHRFMLAWVGLFTAIIILNQLWYNFNFWTFTYNI
jgi:uncharacterized membrane protein YgaE (UPF0421/DUF939 family)